MNEKRLYDLRYKVTPDDEQEILRLRKERKTLDFIGERIGISRSRVSQILDKLFAEEAKK